MENTSDGWICLWRDLINKPIWLCSTPEQKVVLITLLCMANHEPREWEWKGKRYTVQAGQMITSLKSIAEKCGADVTTRNVRTALKRFENYGFLTSKSTNKNRLVTIVNWRKYQDKNYITDKQTDKQLTSNRQATDKRLTTNNNKNNNNNDNKSVCLSLDTLSIYKGIDTQKDRTDGQTEHNITENVEVPSSTDVPSSISDTSTTEVPPSEGVPSPKTRREFESMLKSVIEYERLCKNYERYAVDAVVDTCKAMIVADKVTLAKVEYTAKDVACKLLTLDYDKMCLLIKKFEDIQKMEQPRNPMRYHQAVIWGVIQNYAAEKAMQQAKEPKKSGGGKFANYEQRGYEHEKLEDFAAAMPDDDVLEVYRARKRDKSAVSEPTSIADILFAENQRKYGKKGSERCDEDSNSTGNEK